MPFQRKMEEKWCMATLHEGYPWYQVWIPSGLERLDVIYCISLFLLSSYLSINFLMKVVPCVARPIINKLFGNDKFLTLYTEDPKGLRQLYDVDVSLTMATTYLGGRGWYKYVRENGLRQ